MSLGQFLQDNLPWLASPAGPGHLAYMLLMGFIPALAMVLVVITPVGLMAVWAERRLSGRIQARIGPNRVGPAGLFQSIADGVKLLGKEDYVPPGGDKLLFLAAPLIVFAGALGLYAVLPLSDGLQPIDPNVGVFYVTAVGAIEVIGVLMAGWASNNKWSLIGAMREVAQVVSYEIPMGITILCPVVLVGSLRLGEIISFQANNSLDLWGLDLGVLPLELGWNVLRAFPFNLIALVIFYMCCLANLKRAPFDLPEAESELVAGFLTEYSGMRWSLFFLGEYAAMFALSGITAALFLGGWTGPVHALIGGDAGSMQSVIGGVLEFTWKTSLLFLLMMQVRWTLPRLRLDQVMSLCYKYLIPFALVCLLAGGAAALVRS